MTEPRRTARTIPATPRRVRPRVERGAPRARGGAVKLVLGAPPGAVVAAEAAAQRKRPPAAILAVEVLYLPASFGLTTDRLPAAALHGPDGD